jgi:hypothetical protein
LFDEKGRVEFDFGGKRITVIGRTIFDDVGDVNIGAVETDGLKELVKNLTGGATERAAGFGFVFARSFADKDNGRSMRTLADDGVVAVFETILIKRRGGEAPDLIANFFEFSGAVGHGMIITLKSGNEKERFCQIRSSISVWEKKKD